MGQQFDHRRNIDWEALGMGTPELGELNTPKADAAPQRAPDILDKLFKRVREQKRIRLSESEEIRIELFQPEEYAPPIDDEAVKLLQTKNRKLDLPEETLRKLQHNIEHFRSWRDADEEVKDAERKRRQELGIEALADRIQDSIFDGPLPLEEEAELCREYMRLTGKSIDRVIGEFFSGAAKDRASDVRKLLTEEPGKGDPS